MIPISPEPPRVPIVPHARSDGLPIPQDEPDGEPQLPRVEPAVGSAAGQWAERIAREHPELTEDEVAVLTVATAPRLTEHIRECQRALAKQVQAT